MAGSLSDYLENAFLDHMLGRSSTEMPATGGNSSLYVALLTIAYADTWTPLATGECQGSTYSRLAIPNSSNSFTNATAGSIQNKGTVGTTWQFTTSAGADWGTIKSMALCDTSSTTTGNMLWGADLAADQVISAGNTVQFTTGSLVITQS